MTSKDPLEDEAAQAARAERNRRADIREMAREIAREVARIQAANSVPVDDQTAPSFRPITADLITGGNEQCEHGVPHGAYLRPTSGTPACPMCRLRYLDEQRAAQS
jgi:hypothetical protein